MKNNKKTKIFILAIILICPILFAYNRISGNRIVIDELSYSSKEQIVQVYNLRLGNLNDIKSLTFMSLGMDNFIVLELNIKDIDSFLLDNYDNYQNIEQLPRFSFIFPNKQYMPNGDTTVYLNGNKIYISEWGTEKEISDLFFSIYTK